MASSDGRTGGSSRRGKKISTSDMPKQPQRGLGVAQLEKIRLQNQMMISGYTNKEDQRVLQMTHPTSPSSSTITTSTSYVLPPYNNYNMANFNNHVATDLIRYSEPYSNASTSSSTIIIPTYYEQQQQQQLVTLPLLEQNMERDRGRDRCNGSINHFSIMMREAPELDLELRLSN